MILISGGGLAHPIELTDPESMKAFDPWRGQFADWQQQPFVDAPCFRRSFAVLFYMKWPGRKSPLDRGDVNMIYATRYCSAGANGYVYLPGPGEPNYHVNIGTIIRGDADGKWHVATQAWNALLSDAVATSDQQRTVDMILISGGELKHPVEVTDPELLRNLDPWTGSFVDWEQPAGGGCRSWEYEVLYFKRAIDQTTPYDMEDLHMIYGLRYCIDEDGGPGSVHLAGRNDKFGPENVKMVWDGTYAGKWHRSTAAWNAFIEREVADQRSSR